MAGDHVADKSDSRLLVEEQIDRVLRWRRGEQYREKLGDNVVNHLYVVIFDEVKGHFPNCKGMSKCTKQQYFLKQVEKILSTRRIDRAVRDVARQNSVTVVLQPYAGL